MSVGDSIARALNTGPHKMSAPPRMDPGGAPDQARLNRLGRGYFRLPETSPKVVLRRVPRAVSAVMIATAISEAIRAYSMAVAPDSLATNFLMDLIIAFAPAAEFVLQLSKSLAQRMTRINSVNFAARLIRRPAIG